MISPGERWLEFQNDTQKIKYLKAHKVISPKAKEIKTLYYTGAYTSSPTICQVVGYQSDHTCIIKVNGKLHCLNADYLAEMQKGMSNYVSGDTDLEGDSEEPDQTPANFIAIDFETANRKRTSACSIGVAIVKDGCVVESKHFFIRPEPFQFDYFNVMIHGINEEMVENAPSFNELWDELAPMFEGQLIVAHNSSFDISVLRALCDLYNLAYPNVDLLCSYKLAEAVSPTCGCYRLDYLCTKYDIDLENHHHAEADAIACANLTLKLLEECQSGCCADLLKKNIVSPGCLNDLGRYEPCRKYNTNETSGKPNRYRVSSINSLEAIHTDNQFTGKRFIFTGKLLSMTRYAAQQLVARGGGDVGESVGVKTDYLVCGYQDATALRGAKMSSKMAQALALAEQGYNIKIIQEDEFLDMIDEELWAKFQEVM